jgi:CheY-like chemotaxis protein
MKKTESLVIIDDDEDDRDLFLYALAKVNPAVLCLTFADAEDALRDLNKASLVPDMIFLDLNLPRLSGRQFLVELKKYPTLKNIPVVIYTTSSIEKDIEETKQLGATHFLTKPYSIPELCKALSQIIDGPAKL